MRFRLALQTLQTNALLPFNYQYPLSAAIYKIIERADKDFSAFLHNKGYTAGGKTVKLFTFSDIQTPFAKQDDRMRLTTRQALLTICFYMPQAAEHFIKGLFVHQQLEIADAGGKVVFSITGVGGLSDGVMERWGDVMVVLQPLSPLIAGRKNNRRHYDYRSPEDTDFADCLLYNWLEKWCAVHGVSEKHIEALRSQISIQVQLLKHPPQQRLITIKAGTPAETKIRGYTKFRLLVKVPKALLELALGTGLGLHNALGFGCVEIMG